jgi:hypothetical protein
MFVSKGKKMREESEGHPPAFKRYGCWGRASRSAPAYPGFLGDAPKQANDKYCQAIQKV